MTGENRTDDPHQVGVREVCSICQFPVGADEERTQCPDCGLPFHAECWEANFGCSAYGCPQVNALKPAAPPAPPTAPVPPVAVPPVEPFPWDYLLLGASVLSVLASLFTLGLPSALLLLLVLGSRIFRKGRTSCGVVLLSVVVCLAGMIGGAVAAHYLGTWPAALRFGRR
jgi:hypothetical protein